MYIMENELGHLKRLKYGIRLQSWGKPTRLYKSDVEEIQEYHADFLERHNVKVVEVA